ncbi:MAG: hypothetical protein JWO28_1159 [Hyphomicrobiales bacterium]|nr:hypothetical protein [Hyphomicrobiales bacterium]
MAKITWLAQDTGDLGSVLNLAVNGTHEKAIYSLDGGGKMVVYGEDLKMQGGELVDGKIDKVVFKNAEGDSVISATHLKLKAEKFGDAAADGGGEDAFYSLFGGNDVYYGSDDNDYSLNGRNGDDKIFGRNGSEVLRGGRGDDELTGGKGVDAFAFYTADGVGHDVIHDLHTTGPAMDQLQIEESIVSVKSVHGGDDTLLKLADGSTILIEDVTKAEFNDYWI